MPPRLPTGILFAVLFTIAMGMHLVLTDRGLQEHYPTAVRSPGPGRPGRGGEYLLGMSSNGGELPFYQGLLSRCYSG